MGEDDILRDLDESIELDYALQFVQELMESKELWKKRIKLLRSCLRPSDLPNFSRQLITSLKVSVARVYNPRKPSRRYTSISSNAWNTQGENARGNAIYPSYTRVRINNVILFILIDYDLAFGTEGDYHIHFCRFIENIIRGIPSNYVKIYAISLKLTTGSLNWTSKGTSGDIFIPFKAVEVIPNTINFPCQLTPVQQLGYVDLSSVFKEMAKLLGMGNSLLTVLIMRKDSLQVFQHTLCGTDARHVNKLADIARRSLEMLKDRIRRHVKKFKIECLVVMENPMIEAGSNAEVREGLAVQVNKLFGRAVECKLVKLEKESKSK